jgi:putative NAD(P)H nitroreductase
MSDFLKVLNQRTSAEHFAQHRFQFKKSRKLISQASSAFIIQHRRFIAVTDERIRERLKGTTIAPNQVANAPLVFLILGDSSWRVHDGR